jgi:hypothetical protein
MKKMQQAFFWSRRLLRTFSVRQHKKFSNPFVITSPMIAASLEKLHLSA